LKVFDYQCISCDAKDERFIKELDDIQFCHKCGDEMKKLVSAPAMVKGNFYNDKCGTRK